MYLCVLQVTFRKTINKALEELAVDMSPSECTTAMKTLVTAAKGPEFLSEIVATIVTWIVAESRNGKRKELVALLPVAVKANKAVRGWLVGCFFVGFLMRSA